MLGSVAGTGQEKGVWPCSCLQGVAVGVDGGQLLHRGDTHFLQQEERGARLKKEGRFPGRGDAWGQKGSSEFSRKEGLDPRVGWWEEA